MERTCLVTKQKLPVSELLRFTVQEKVLVFDQETKRPGRGGYVVKDSLAVIKLPLLKKKIKYFLKTSEDFEISEDEIKKALTLF